MQPVSHAKPLVTMQPFTCQHLPSPHLSIKQNHCPSLLLSLLSLVFSLSLSLSLSVCLFVCLVSIYAAASMAERDRPQPHQLQVHPQHRYEAGMKSLLPQRGPSATKVLVVLVMLPIGGTLLALSGITLTGTVIGLCISTPLFILFSPVIVPAAIVLGLAVTGFFTSGALGLTALSSLSWVLNNLRKKTGTMPEMADQAKRRMAGMAEYVGQKTKEVGQEIQVRAHEKTGRT